MLENKLNKKDINFLRIVWFGLLLGLILTLHSKHLLDSDEGTVLAGAWDMINGRGLYYDFFEFIPPGVFYLLFFIWKIFGVSYINAKIAALVALFLSVMGIFFISRRLTRSKISYLIPPAFLLITYSWPLITYHTFNFLFTVWALYFFLRYLETENTRMIFLSGFFTCLASLFLQNRGFVLMVAVAACLGWHYFKKNQAGLFKAVLCYLGAATLPLLLLLLKWPFFLLYDNLISFPLTEYHRIVVNNYPLIIIFLAAVLFVGFLEKNGPDRVRYLLVIQAIFLLAAFSNADCFHVAIVLFPLFSLLPYLIGAAGAYSRPNKLILGILFFVLYGTLFFSALGFMLRFPPGRTIAGDYLLTLIKKECDGSDYLYAGPFLPGLYFETRKLSPVPSSYFITGHNTKEQFEAAVSALKGSKPQCAILNYNLVRKYAYNENNPIDNYIRSNYRLIFSQKDYRVYKIFE